MLDPEQTARAKSLKPRDKFVFSFFDQNGDRALTSWDLPIPDLFLKITYRKNYGKCYIWTFSRFAPFIWDSLGKGISIQLFEREMYDIIGIPMIISDYMFKPVNAERFTKMNENRKRLLEDSITTVSDLQMLDKDAKKVVDKELLKSKSLIHIGKSNALARLEGRDVVLDARKSNISNLAVINMPPKEF